MQWAHNPLLKIIIFYCNIFMFQLNLMLQANKLLCTHKNILLFWGRVGECACGEGVRRGAQGSIHSPSSSASACAVWETEGEGYTHLRSFWTPAWWWEWLPGGGEEGGKWSEWGTGSAWATALFCMISLFLINETTSSSFHIFWRSAIILTS